MNRPLAGADAGSVPGAVLGITTDEPLARESARKSTEIAAAMRLRAADLGENGTLGAPPGLRFHGFHLRSRLKR
jgi:hypothetical protein